MIESINYQLRKKHSESIEYYAHYYITYAFFICFFCRAELNSVYTVSTVYQGNIGKSNVTMYLTISNGSVYGDYIYNKYKKIILLNGSAKEGVIDLKEGNGMATMRLKTISNGYQGEWCDKKCVPVMLVTKNSFRYGGVEKVDISESGEGNYKVTLFFKERTEQINITDSIDEPSLEFTDLNGDGFYDLIVRTDHRVSNGSQVVYLSTSDMFKKNQQLTKENGSLVFNPFTRLAVYNSSDESTHEYKKVIYSLDGANVKRIDSLSYDFKSNKGFSYKQGDITKNSFESY